MLETAAMANGIELHAKLEAEVKSKVIVNVTSRSTSVFYVVHPPTMPFFASVQCITNCKQHGQGTWVLTSKRHHIYSP
jgi:hypothetical protein